MYKKSIKEQKPSTAKTFKEWAEQNVRNITFSINFVKEPDLYDLVFVKHGDNKAEFIRECIRKYGK